MTVTAPMLLALIFWLPFFIRPFWPAALWTMGAVVTLGWMTTVARGRRGWVPVPLLALAGWALVRTAWQGWHFMLGRDGVPGLLLFPVGCVLLALAAVHWMTTWEDREAETALTTLRWALAGLVVWGWLQAFSLDQWSVVSGGPDVIGGTVGNPTLFAALLAMAVPLWMTWQHRAAQWVTWAAIALIIRCGSATGCLAMAAAIGWTAWIHGTPRPLVRLSCWCWLAVSPLILWWAGHHNAFNPFGRYEAWAAWVEVWRHGSPPTWGMASVKLLGAPAAFWAQPVTGFGLGAVWSLANEFPVGHILRGWNHAHNEFLQILPELGVIGVALLGWVLARVWGCLRRCCPQSQACYGGMLLASLVSAMTSFPWHVPQTAFMTLFATSRIITEGA